VKLFYKIIRVGCALAVIPWLLCSGCADMAVQNGGTYAPMQDDYKLGEKLLDEVFDTYRNYTRDSFDRIVSRDFAPIKSEFMNNVERAFYAARVMEIYYYVDTANVRDNLAAISFHWEKKVSTYSGGAINNSTGNAEFVFKNEGDRWNLYQVGGDDPLSRV